MNGKVFIYNLRQAKYYINNGIKCIDTDIHKRTGKVYWVFHYNECQDMFSQWCRNNEGGCKQQKVL